MIWNAPLAMKNRKLMRLRKPFYEDHCGHGPDAYAGRISYSGELMDAYFWEDSLGWTSCLRYGNEDHEYLSTGKPQADTLGFGDIEKLSVHDVHNAMNDQIRHLHYFLAFIGYQPFRF